MGDSQDLGIKWVELIWCTEREHGQKGIVRKRLKYLEKYFLKVQGHG